MISFNLCSDQFSSLPMTARYFSELNDIDKEDIGADMQDWETYMYCKEFQECSKIISSEDVQYIRGYDIVTNSSNTLLIKYGSESKADFTNGHHETDDSESNPMLFSPSFNKMQIRSHEIPSIEFNEAEEQDRTKKAEIDRSRGNKAYNCGQYEKACEYYSNCIRYVRYQKLKEAYNNRAQANMKLNNFASAILDLNIVLELDPQNEKALYRKAKTYEHLLMYHEALENIESLRQKMVKLGSAAEVLYKSLKKKLACDREKTYVIRQNFDPHATIEVDVSQLWSYATIPPYYNKNYLIEVDYTGCFKTCVCGFCSEEDRRKRKIVIGLRIREPYRWKLLTVELLKEMKIPKKEVDQLQESENKKLKNGMKENGNNNLDERCSTLMNKIRNNNLDICNNNIPQAEMNNNIKNKNRDGIKNTFEMSNIRTNS